MTEKKYSRRELLKMLGIGGLSAVGIAETERRFGWWTKFIDKMFLGSPTSEPPVVGLTPPPPEATAEPPQSTVESVEVEAPYLEIGFDTNTADGERFKSFPAVEDYFTEDDLRQLLEEEKSVGRADEMIQAVDENGEPTENLCILSHQLYQAVDGSIIAIRDYNREANRLYEEGPLDEGHPQDEWSQDGFVFVGKKTIVDYKGVERSITFFDRVLVPKIDLAAINEAIENGLPLTHIIGNLGLFLTNALNGANFTDLTNPEARDNAYPAAIAVRGPVADFYRLVLEDMQREGIADQTMVEVFSNRPPIDLANGFLALPAGVWVGDLYRDGKRWVFFDQFNHTAFVVHREGGDSLDLPDGNQYETGVNDTVGEANHARYRYVLPKGTALNSDSLLIIPIPRIPSSAIVRE